MNALGEALLGTFSEFWALWLAAGLPTHIIYVSSVLTLYR